MDEVFLGGFKGNQDRLLVTWHQGINSTWERVHIQCLHRQVYAGSEVSNVPWNGLVPTTCGSRVAVI